MLRGERGQDRPPLPEGSFVPPQIHHRRVPHSLSPTESSLSTTHGQAHLSPCQNALIGIKLRTPGSTSLKSDSSHRQEGVENVPHATFSGRKNLTETVAITVLTLRKARLIYHLCPKFPVQVTHSPPYVPPPYLSASSLPSSSACPLILTVTYWSQVKR